MAGVFGRTAPFGSEFVGDSRDGVFGHGCGLCFQVDEHVGGEDAQNGFAPSGDFVAVGVCLRDEGVDEFGRDAGVFALEFDDVGGVVEFGVGEELFE